MSTELQPVTAEVVSPLDPAAAKRLDSRIRLLVNAINDNIAKLHDLVDEAKRGDVHTVLGYRSWTEYLADVFTVQVRLDRGQRRELVGYLSGEGMSNRVVADVVGVDEITVRRDKAGATNVAPEPERVADGEPAPKLKENVDRCDLCNVNPARRGDCLCDACFDFEARRHGDPTLADLAAKSSAPVTGRDGKTYRPSVSPTPKPKADAVPPKATFAQLMKRLTELNRVADECLDIAADLDFSSDAHWNRLVYDSAEQYESASTLAESLAQLAGSIVNVIEGR